MLRTFLRRLFSGDGGLLPAGTPAPEFRLSDQNGDVVSSRDLAGERYVLWFYPKAATPG